MTATTAPTPTTTQIAVAALIQALDNSPRAHWGKVIEMALQAVIQKGYGEGYAVGAANLETVQEKLEVMTERAVQAEAMLAPGSLDSHPKAPEVKEPPAAPIPAVTETVGEDKSLANETSDPDEELVDLGYQALRKLAVILGGYVKHQGLDPSSIGVSFSADPESKIGGSVLTIFTNQKNH